MNTKEQTYRVKPDFKAAKKDWLNIDYETLTNGGTFCEVFECEDLVKMYFDFDFKNLKTEEEFNNKKKLIIENYYNDLLDIIIEYFESSYIGDINNID